MNILKKKLNILLLTLLSVLCLDLFFTILGNCSYAMTKSEAFEICRENCGYANLFNAPSENNGNNLLSYNNFLTYLDNQTNNYMFVTKTSTATSNTSFDILFFDTFSEDGNNYSFNLNTNRMGSRKSSYSFNNYYNTNQYTQQANNSNDGTFPTANGTFYMVYGDGEILRASFDIPSQLTFTPYYDKNNLTITVGTRTYNNVYGSYYNATLDLQWRSTRTVITR